MQTDTLLYIKRGIQYVCTHFRNRCAGSGAETDCQNYFMNELRQWSDEVREEEFRVHPRAFLGWIWISGALGILSVAAALLAEALHPVLARGIGFMSILLCLLPAVFEFLLYRRFIDFLFPGAVSKNVIAVRNPAGEIKKRIILGGHADAAFEFTYIRGGGWTGLVVLAGSAAGAGFVFLLNIIRWFPPGILEALWNPMRWTAAAFLPFFVALLFFINWKVIADGANDNLSGCFTAMSILKDMAENGQRFAHTQVCCLISGAEESGLRGALAYAERHQSELREVETVFIALDTLRETKHLQIYTRGQNGLQKNCEALERLISRAGSDCGVPLTVAKSYPGATDAEAFSRLGIRASGICGANHIPQRYYHTRHDTCDNIDETCLRSCLVLCKRIIALFDLHGIGHFCPGCRRNCFAAPRKETPRMGDCVPPPEISRRP